MRVPPVTRAVDSVDGNHLEFRAFSICTASNSIGEGRPEGRHFCVSGGGVEEGEGARAGGIGKLVIAPGKARAGAQGQQFVGGGVEQKGRTRAAFGQQGRHGGGAGRAETGAWHGVCRGGRRKVPAGGTRVVIHHAIDPVPRFGAARRVEHGIAVMAAGRQVRAVNVQRADLAGTGQHQVKPARRFGRGPPQQAIAGVDGDRPRGPGTVKRKIKSNTYDHYKRYRNYNKCQTFFAQS